MCKILIIPGVNKHNHTKVRCFIETITPLMTQTPDNDGFGYATIDKNGKIYGEKWVDVKEAFKVRNYKKPEKPILPNMFGEALKPVEVSTEIKYLEFGKASKSIPLAYIVHSRNKTRGEITAANSHPFFELDDESVAPTALVHNGTIVNHEKLSAKKYSSCDSEVILHEWIKNKVNENIENVASLAETLIGTYAVGLLSTVQLENGETRQVVDVFKSNKELYCAFIEELETYVFLTNQRNLMEAVKTLGYTIRELHEFKDGFYFRIDAQSANVLESVEFNTSKQTEWVNNYNNNTNYNRHRPENFTALGGRTTSKATTAEEIKKKFEQNHSELFLEYFEVGELTEKEKETLKALERDTSPFKARALSLVKMALAQKAN